MKKIIVMLFVLTTAVLSVCAQCRVVEVRRVYCSSTTQCRVTEGRGCYCDNGDNAFLQVNVGMGFYNQPGFYGALSYGYKHHSGVVVGLQLNGRYNIQQLSLGMCLFSNYEFTPLRKYTGIFYPVVGLRVGFAGMELENFDAWEALPQVGYNVGFFFELIPQTLDAGIEYNSNYNFAVQRKVLQSAGFLDHNTVISLRVHF